ncbi:hypothetical protein B0A55_02021 [Friedmanniomyces simplex]|uniref:Cryptic loci regulator 2 N-terminal domain-containing protein n=1 Tax=Friedmanniomyces simplex TaxID=329884 RepID=A0A4U0XSE2_9PEZI|nr:hypothetical protein B0A55_02021 [Friedmanniomyces simplex]
MFATTRLVGPLSLLGISAVEAQHHSAILRTPQEFRRNVTSHIPTLTINTLATHYTLARIPEDFQLLRFQADRVVHGNVIYPSFTPAVPPIEEEVEDPAVQLTYSDGNTFGVADAEGQVYVKPIHAKRVAVHFCGRGKCCTRVAGERWIVADRIDHLPICHAWCWERERDRLKQMEVERNGLPLCHRRCYNEAVSQLDDPGATEEVVPHMRVLHERLREKTLACHFQDHQNERRIAKRRAETWFEAS